VPLNATSAVILGLLHNGPLSGGDIVAEAELRLAAQGGVTRSQVYRELPGLDREGLVALDDSSDPGRRASQAYAITTEGRSAFVSWALAPISADQVRSGTVLRLGFGAHLGAAVRHSIVESAIVDHELALAEHEQCAKNLRESGDEFAAAAAEFAVVYERAFLSWLHSVPLG
jgi:DNA-binding PadR family transcriptional regulator